MPKACKEYSTGSIIEHQHLCLQNGIVCFGLLSFLGSAKAQVAYWRVLDSTEQGVFFLAVVGLFCVHKCFFWLFFVWFVFCGLLCCCSGL